MITLHLYMPWVVADQIFEQAAVLVSVFYSKLLLSRTCRQVDASVT